MEAVVTVVALVFVLCVVLGVYATVKAVGAAKRGVDRTIAQARRKVEDTTLRAKTFAQPGPSGELAHLRLTLRTTMRATQDALHAGVTEDESLKESLDLFKRLSAHGFELDADLKRLEAEPDQGVIASRLPGLRERAERITGSANSLRWAAHDRARRFAEDDLDTLSAQIDVEAGALRHWVKESPTTSEGSTSEGSTSDRSWPRTPEADAGVAAGAGAGAGADVGRTRPGTTPEARTPKDSARPALTPPAQRPVHPWQRKAHPESTS
ncbi:hypothetical protein NGF19_01680 [Streptomyces sp. RY43-2]|uniref:Secreted protein n=1 Tax=Streptomyces macrolidinus TaxID=2952607 RepID=A0ABT0Z6W1_9ACTN|nr:hypothetical protein [Streptomyces macrolidinus]MCN9239503.1 hypothetical protein [Streptomyces macrolidinus]